MLSRISRKSGTISKKMTQIHFGARMRLAVVLLLMINATGVGRK